MKRELNRLNAGYFYGTVLRSCATTEFTLTETAYSSGVKLPEHAHERAYFCFVLQGCFAESYGSQSHECHATTLIFHPRGEMHSDYFHTAARCFNLQIDSKLTDRLQLQTPMMDCLAHFRGGLLAQLAARLYREFRGMDELSPLVVEALTLEMVVEAFRHSSRQQKGGPPRWLNRARKLLDDDFREPHTLSEISAYAQVHPAHLAATFAVARAVRSGNISAGAALSSPAIESPGQMLHYRTLLWKRAFRTRVTFRLLSNE